MSIYTLYAFVQRKPNAVFFAKTYLIIVFVYNILILALSYLDPETNRQSLRSTIWSVLWYIYLVESKQVKRVIPVSFRRLTIYDYLAVALCVLIPVCIGIAACVIDSGKDFNYSRSNALFMKNVKLREGEFTDSIIIFTSPKGFTTEKDTENATTFTVHDDGGATAIIYGDYFEGEFTDEDYAEYYSLFEEAPEEGETKTDISDKKYVVNNHDCHQRVAQYSIYGDDDATVFWRFVVMYDSETSKICIISSYDNGGTDYLNDLLLSVRFK
jgi:ferredoxin